MIRIRSLALLLICLLAVLGGAAYLFRGDIAVALMERTLAHNLSQDAVAALPEGLHGIVCGSGSPFPDISRAGPCFAVIAGGRVYVVDTGSGGSEVLARLGVPPGRIEAVLYTHFHSDHLDGFGEFLIQRWAGGGADTPLPVYGPDGVEEIVGGFNAVYRQDAGYRVAHHGADIVKPQGAGAEARPFRLPRTLIADAADPVVVLADNGLTVTAMRVDHAPVEPAVAYRFDYMGRALVVSGDTNAVPAVMRASQGADVLVHDALSPRLVGLIETAAGQAGRPNIAKIMRDIPDYHASPEMVARLAEEAGVPVVVLTHLVPPLPLSALEGPFIGDARSLYRGRLELARDGLVISLPAGGRDVILDWR